ncbi:hypothetical protein S3E15_03898 [Bacillus mycoides]|uniref:Uncharacterized protein n=1 Tax=Bacillus mycoides TaxID=1405 RepID=A0AAP8BCB0_BACMY|nr:hypothetical protein S3E15_03898 [Bacillus mycoides]OSX89540.1 hypothetical protein BTJ45_04844 [Bacillus mycoides]OSY00734.1 hypothetical protein S2E19_04512 [Bacillus mycoides]OSY05760.1 hypothetical protein BTJ48_03925 [Bacillus mycoides]
MLTFVKEEIKEKNQNKLKIFLVFLLSVEIWIYITMSVGGVLYK